MRGLGRALVRTAKVACVMFVGLAGCKKAGGAGPTAEVRKLAERTVAKVQSKAGCHYSLPYRVFVPPAYDAAKRYPLILYLHHGGNRGNDNLAQLNEEFALLVSDAVQAIEPTFVVAPQCPASDQWVNASKTVPFVNYVQANVPEADAAKLTLDVLASMRREYSVDPARVYVTGSSMGASGTWDYITRYPGIFAAALPVNGLNDPSRAPVIAKLPIWSFHGEKDDVSPVGNTRAMVDALRKLGSPIKYTELPGIGHGCGPIAYGNIDVLRWLLAQRLTP